MTDPIRIERGTPTAQELAALVGVLYASRGATPTPPPATPRRWVLSARPNIRLRAGAGAWRAIAQPRP